MLGQGWITGCVNIVEGKEDTHNCHNEMNTAISQWLTETLLPALQDPSVFFMDLATYHKGCLVQPSLLPLPERQISNIGWTTTQTEWNHMTTSTEDPVVARHNRVCVGKAQKSEHQVLRLPPPPKALWLKPNWAHLGTSQELCSGVQFHIQNETLWAVSLPQSGGQLFPWVFYSSDLNCNHLEPQVHSSLRTAPSRF